MAAMAIVIDEKFQVDAPLDAVWRFMMSPENVAACMPGASLSEVIDERRFLGTIKLKVGAVTAAYQGTISFSEVDEANHRITMLAEAKEKGGGTVKGTILSSMTVHPDGSTEVVCESKIELTGRIMQVGRGMIQGVSQQLFKKFVENTQNRLEAPAATGDAQEGAGAQSAGDPAALAQVSDDSIAVVPLLFQTFVAWIKGVFTRLFNFLFRRS
jgi:carbon monoxide dehydrogenase subunit G